MNNLIFRAFKKDSRQLLYNVGIHPPEYPSPFTISAIGLYILQPGNVYTDRFYIVDQYTGIDDRDGDKIFTNDIVAIGEPACETPALCRVGFDRGRYVVYVSWLHENNDIELFTYENVCGENYIKIRGNVHLNADLLKGKE